MGHPSYIPDLVAIDLFLFTYDKNKLRGQGFSSAEAADALFRAHFGDISSRVKNMLCQMIRSKKNLFSLVWLEITTISNIQYMFYTFNVIHSF